jgi:hypothetical protein
LILKGLYLRRIRQRGFQTRVALFAFVSLSA